MIGIEQGVTRVGGIETKADFRVVGYTVAIRVGARQRDLERNQTLCPFIHRLDDDSSTGGSPHQAIGSDCCDGGVTDVVNSGRSGGGQIRLHSVGVGAGYGQLGS